MTAFSDDASDCVTRKMKNLCQSRQIYRGGGLGGFSEGCLGLPIPAPCRIRRRKSTLQQEKTICEGILFFQLWNGAGSESLLGSILNEDDGIGQENRTGRTHLGSHSPWSIMTDPTDPSWSSFQTWTLPICFARYLEDLTTTTPVF